MTIVFFCQSCGARFEVAPKFAGKKGNCKKCGQRMVIPQAEQLASMAAMPALAAAAVGTPAGAQPLPASNWLAQMSSKVGLAPLTIDRMHVGHKKPAKPAMFAEDDLADSKPYALAHPVRETGGRGKVQDHVVVRVWRQQLGKIQKLFRKINQAAYLISVPFLIVLLLGIAVRNRPMALFGATAVVLLNIGRLVAGGANLAVIPLRDGIDLKKMKKPIQRVIEPAITMGLVVIAFTFIPWLSTGQTSKGSVADRIRSGASALGKEMEGEVDKAVDKAKAVDFQKFGTQAQDKLNEYSDKAKGLDLSKLGAGVQEKLKGTASQSDGSAGKTSKPGIVGRIRDGMQSLEKRTQDELDKAKAGSEPKDKP